MLLYLIWQTPESGATEKHPPVPKAASTARAAANKNGSSATAANKTAGTCSLSHTHSHTVTACTVIHLLLYLQCLPALHTWLLLQTVSPFCFGCCIVLPVQHDLYNRTWTLYCSWKNDSEYKLAQLQATELLPYATFYRVQELSFEDTRLVFLSAHHKQYLTSLSDEAVTQSELC